MVEIEGRHKTGALFKNLLLPIKQYALEVWAFHSNFREESTKTKCRATVPTQLKGPSLAKHWCGIVTTFYILT